MKITRRQLRQLIEVYIPGSPADVYSRTGLDKDNYSKLKTMIQRGSPGVQTQGLKLAADLDIPFIKPSNNPAEYLRKWVYQALLGYWMQDDNYVYSLIADLQDPSSRAYKAVNDITSGPYGDKPYPNGPEMLYDTLTGDAMYFAIKHFDIDWEWDKEELQQFITKFARLFETSDYSFISELIMYNGNSNSMMNEIIGLVK